jgi:ADP-ribosylation factor GTPase-activating protein 2/3
LNKTKQKASFFEQHNCTSEDSKTKYNSRAAQLYREKLHQLAIKTQRIYGDKLHIDNQVEDKPKHRKSSETDFFTQESVLQDNNKAKLLSNLAPVEINDVKIDDKSHEGPQVKLPTTTTTETTTTTTITSNIIQKKPTATKKKGLGAQKVNTNFKDIERVLAEQEKQKEAEILHKAKTKEEEEKNLEKQMASMKLAYINADKQRAKEEAKFENDPKKQQQLERLGMAIGNRTSGITHSAISDMQIIQQSNGKNDNNSSNGRSSFIQQMNRNDDFGNSNNFFDEMEDRFDSMSKSSSSNNNNNNKNNRFDQDNFSSSNKSDWVVLDDNKDDFFSKNLQSSSSGIANTQGPSKYSSNISSSSSSYSSDPNGDATKRFANAKSISSAQYFGGDVDNRDDVCFKIKIKKFHFICFNKK